MNNNDKQALITGNATIPYRIIIDGDVENALTEYDIINTTYEDFRYVDTNSICIGQFVARTFSGDIKVGGEKLLIEDKDIEVQMGVQVNDSITWYSLGNFLITKPEDNNVKDKISFKAMDYTKKFNKEFDPTLVSFPCTAGELANNVCEQCGVILGSLTFTNSDFIIQDNQYTEKESCRKIMQDIGKLAYSWVRIGWDNKCYIDFEVKKEVDEYNKITNDNYYDLTTQQKVFGPVNRVIVGLSEDVEGENIYVEDSDSIETYGVTELKIYDNYLTYTPELRQSVIESAKKLFGLTYTPVEMNTTGHPWLIGNELIEIKDMENNLLYTYPFDRTIEYAGHIKTKLVSKADTKTEVEYKNDGSLENALKKTRIIVNKQEGTITNLTQTTTTIQDNLQQNYYDKTQTNQLIQTSSEGITNTFSEAGGNNIFRNTGLWFSATSTEFSLFPSVNIYPSENTFMGMKVNYEFWNGDVTKIKEEKAANMIAMRLLKGDFYQEQTVPNGNYTVSFKYKKLIELANPKVKINDIEYQLSNTDDTEFVENIEVNSNNINVLFTTDINDSCEIYDLMVNAGKVKLAYSQNQNETTTDTVNISKGITITSTNTDTTFKANADGIRTLDKNENVLTQFTDTGMSTKKMIVEDTSVILGTQVQEVGGQTWFTRL